MSELLEGRYFVVRYMVGELRDEAVNIGVIGLDETQPRAIARFLKDLSKKARVDVPFDAKAVSIFRENVERLTADLPARALWNETEWLEQFKGSILESGGNLIQVRGPYSVLTSGMADEIENLFEEWVAPGSRQARSVTYGARDPLGGLRREASSAITRQVRDALAPDLRKPFFRRSHEVRGRKHTTVFDAAVIIKRRTHTREHLFHHVLMLPDAEESFNQAAALLWKWNDVRERNGKDRDLTAVFFSREGTRREGVEAAKTVLRKDKVTVAEMDQIGELVREVHPQQRLHYA